MNSTDSGGSSSMPYSRWEDAMVEQTRLLEAYQTSLGLRYLESVFTDMNYKHKPNERLDPRALIGLQIKTVKDAEPVYVSMDATEIIDHARDSFEPEPVLPSDPFVPNG